MVGQDYERGGMIKHGSKMIQAVANATVPQLTIMCGASFGAGNYGMCGRGYEPRFLFSWPNARTAVMGGEQAATTMRIVAEAGARRKGIAIDEAALDAQEKAIIAHLRAPAKRHRHLQPDARRRHHRPARHPRRAGPVPGPVRRRSSGAACGRCSSGWPGHD